MTRTEMKTPRVMLVRLWKRVRSRLVTEVPDDCRYCEFECRKLQCRQGDWETCATRKREPLPGTELDAQRAYPASAPRGHASRTRSRV